MKPLLDEIAEAYWNSIWTNEEGVLLQPEEKKWHNIAPLVRDGYRKHAQAAIDVVERRLLSEARNRYIELGNGFVDYRCQKVIIEVWQAVKVGDVNDKNVADIPETHDI